MEPETVVFLKRVAMTIFIGFVWLSINVSVGIMFGFAFPEGSIGIGNILYYTWLVASFGFMLWLFYRMWHKFI
jgi:hypothetical protein